MKNFPLFLFLVFVSFAFTDETTVKEVDPSLESLRCTAPNRPSIPVITTDNQNFIFASASSPGGAQGYQWTVSNNAFIISGQGTTSISIGPWCPTPSTIEVCVRAFNGNCFSFSSCQTLAYSGRCFF